MIHQFIVAMPTEAPLANFNNTTQLLTDSSNTTISEDKNKLNVPAVASTVVFAIAELVTCGGLLLIFALRRKTAKHASMIMMSLLLNICIGAITDLALRLPLSIVKEYNLAKEHPKMCVALTLIPDYFMIAILICLPLLSIERLIRLEAKKHLTARQMRHLFGCLLVIGYSMALIVVILPTTDIYSPDVNSKCAGQLLYGYGFSYLYICLTVLSVALTLFFSVAVVFRLKAKLVHLKTTMRKKIILKQGTVSAIVITGLLFVALVPFAAALQLILMCESKEIGPGSFCEYYLPRIIFRTAVIIHKLCLVALPLVFLKLNPTMRRKIILALRKPRQMENIMTISSNTISNLTVSKDSICDDNSVADDLDDDFITISEDLTFGKSGDTKGEVKRRSFGSIRMRSSVMDLVDVMSVISERSEISRSLSYNANEIWERDSGHSSNYTISTTSMNESKLDTHSNNTESSDLTTGSHSSFESSSSIESGNSLLGLNSSIEYRSSVKSNSSAGSGKCRLKGILKSAIS